MSIREQTSATPVYRELHPATEDESVLAGATAAESLGSRAYRHLHDEIVSGRIAGGTVLSEATVAKALGISRTPVGEAVRQLVREGLLEQVPRYGTVVRHLGRTEIVEHYELREALESYAAAQAAKRATAEQIDRINELCQTTHRIANDLGPDARRVVDALILRRFLAADMAFHLAIVFAAGNQRIAEVIHTSRSIARIFSLRRQRHDQQIIADVYEHHRRIADAIAKGDEDQAFDFMLEHIRLSKHQALDCYDADARRGSMELPAEIRTELAQIEEALAAVERNPKRG